MILKAVLEQEDIGYLSGVIEDVIGREPMPNEIQKVWEYMPSFIRDEAIKWGTWDTTFRYNTHTWVSNNLEILNLQNESNS